MSAADSTDTHVMSFIPYLCLSSLQYTKMEMAEATEFAEFLKYNERVTVADLRWNILCSGGVILVANALWRNKTLQTLK